MSTTTINNNGNSAGFMRASNIARGINRSVSARFIQVWLISCRRRRSRVNAAAAAMLRTLWKSSIHVYSRQWRIKRYRCARSALARIQTRNASNANSASALRARSSPTSANARAAISSRAVPSAERRWCHRTHTATHATHFCAVVNARCVRASPPPFLLLLPPRSSSSSSSSSSSR